MDSFSFLKQEEEKVDDVKKSTYNVTIWDFVNAILYKKNREIFCDENSNVYNQFLINRALSQYPDTLLCSIRK